MFTSAIVFTLSYTATTFFVENEKRNNNRRNNRPIQREPPRSSSDAYAISHLEGPSPDFLRNGRPVIQMSPCGCDQCAAHRR